MTTQAEPKPVNLYPEFMYGVEDQEILTALDEGEAAEAILDEMEDVPEYVEVVKYRRRSVSIPNWLDPLNTLLEHLDEEYGDPDGSRFPATPRMISAGRALVEAVHQDYRSYQMDPVETIRVPVDREKVIRERLKALSV